MKIAIGSDHAGFNYKERIKKFLKDSGHEVVDFGTDSTAPVDYPLFIRPVAEAVSREEFDRGIVLGGSGNGEAMVANRIRGIRCALCWDRESARLARQHNNANMLSLGERMMPEETALDIVKVWIETAFEGGRHEKRIAQIDERKGVDEGAPVPAGKIKSDKNRGKAFVKEGGDKTGEKEWDMLLAFRFVKYIEGKNSIEFNIDPGLKSPTVIHVPSPETWKKEMPDWAVDRRDEILGRLKPKCQHLEPEWRDY
jgi:ribose 5-phosphate isomerase B